MQIDQLDIKRAETLSKALRHKVKFNLDDGEEVLAMGQLMAWLGTFHKRMVDSMMPVAKEPAIAVVKKGKK